MLSSIFGLSIKYEKWEHTEDLPFYIAESYDFYTGCIGTKRCIFLMPIDELATLPALKKHIEKIQRIDNVPVVFELKTISNYRRNALIENNISFVTKKQAYLPFIGTLLMNETEPEKIAEKFVSSTQQLFLYYFYGQQKRLYVSEAVKALPFSAMTVTRAVKQLEATDLFYVAKDGVNKFIESKYNRLELFDRAKKYLSSPVYKTGYIDKMKVSEDMAYAGETLLSKETMLNPSRVVTYAVKENEQNKSEIIEELVDPDKQVKLELWAYDPKAFSQNNMADDISVILSLKDNEDERIEEAIDELLEKLEVGMKCTESYSEEETKKILGV